MKLNEIITAPGYEDFLAFDNIDEDDSHNAYMIMFKFLSEIEEVNHGKFSRKKIAELIGTSPSYITQLFRGDKLINMITLAKFERILDIEFEITARLKSKQKTEVLPKMEIYYFSLNDFSNTTNYQVASEGVKLEVA